MFVRWAKTIIDDSCEDEPLRALSNTPPPLCFSLYVRWTKCIFSCSCRPRSHSEAKVRGGSSSYGEKKPHFAPSRLSSSAGRLRKLHSRGWAPENVHAALCIDMRWSISACCCGAVKTLRACQSFQVSFFCVISLIVLAPTPSSHFFSGQNSRGRDGRSP